MSHLLWVTYTGTTSTDLIEGTNYPVVGIADTRVVWVISEQRTIVGINPGQYEVYRIAYDEPRDIETPPVAEQVRRARIKRPKDMP
jgi:hypothetical protein